MIELSVATKVTIIPTFDPLVKLHFLPKDTIHSFYHHMLQPFTYNHHYIYYYWSGW